MTNGEKKLLQIIQRYEYNAVRLAETEERIRGETYKVTPSYNNTGGGRANGNHSKVEDFAERSAKLKEDVKEYRRQIRVAEAALHCPDLTTTESRILWWISAGLRLSGFADREGIYISRVYKIRDKALRKALKHIETT